ncbi:MAG: hypothetical protein EOQ46_26410 [Mesorhizobium sp.]|uniref:hypothetical protein n=1 Tax=Mesorhizobium sp. TaxID=1871066 RepID=UPI000FEA9285|nr:hypothetical protein [Mesorhizobium sp.]RWB39767.1 MAG: hypothetical protein EOQ46_26410 [Mesorhizobium sp.]
MSNARPLFHLWKRQVFLRERHREFDALLSTTKMRTGIYLIGCGGEVVYVGQTWDLAERPIQSLGNFYHRVPDVSLPWSIAFAPCDVSEMDERESTAMRRFAPRFNTSIPSVAKSEGRMPDIIRSAAVFHDQAGPCGAFKPENLLRQTEIAAANANPPWARKRTRRASPRPRRVTNFIPVELTKEQIAELVAHHGVSLTEPLRFKINLCKDGSVVTRDGEIVGTWVMDENEHPSFIPDGSSEPMFFHVFLGSLCQRIEDWLENEAGRVAG